MNNKTMTNKTVEAIKNNSNSTTQELFELVNAYEITMLSIQDKTTKSFWKWMLTILTHIKLNMNLDS